MRTTRWLTTFAVALLSVKASESQQIAGFEISEYMTRIDGERSPTLVRKDLVMELFVALYASNVDWTAEDAEVVNNFRDLYSEQRAKNRAFVEESFEKACEPIVGYRFSPQGVYAFLNEMAAVRAEELRRMDVLYDEFLTSLSSGGRLLTEAVSEGIAPGIRQSEFDLARLAIAANESLDVSARLYPRLRERCESGSAFGDEVRRASETSRSGQALADQ